MSADAPDPDQLGRGGMGDLGQRLLVAVIGIPVALGLLYLGGWTLGIPLAGLAAVGTLEVYRMARSRGVRAFRWAGGVSAAGLVLLAVLRPTFGDASGLMLSTLGVLTAGTLVSALFTRGPEGAPLTAVAVTLAGAVYTGLALAFVPLLHALPGRLAWTGGAEVRYAGALVVALPLAATWIGDAAAYFAGTAWGRAKLFPSVSPNKSWVGAWAGVTGAALAGLGWHWVAGPFLPGSPLSALGALCAGALLGVAAILGDLVESLLKREAGLKDSGAVFPGHGGALDRLDALIATMPFAYVLLVLAERVA
jgi:phosphatidate cytidylyltransferase